MTPTLAEISERVGKATGADRGLDWHIADATGHPSFESKFDGMWPPFMVGSKLDKAVPPYTASIDAALSLVARVLPGFDYILEHTNGGLTISCLLGTADPDKRAWGNTLPLAILLAALKSLSEKNDATE